MFLLLNLLWVVLDWSLFLSSPNKDNTNFQIFFVLGMSIFILNLLVSLPMIVMANASDRGTSEYKVENSTNESNSISKSENITLTFPWRSYNFRNVTLNPKFIATYYKLQNKEKRNFFEYITFTLLKEYFYFKSVKSYYIRKR